MATPIDAAGETLTNVRKLLAAGCSIGPTYTTYVGQDNWLRITVGQTGCIVLCDGTEIPYQCGLAHAFAAAVNAAMEKLEITPALA